MKLRTSVLTIHRSIGVVLGLVLLVIGLTGSTLVFYRELDQLLNPQLMQVVAQGKRLSPEVVLNTVRTTFPDMKLNTIILPRTSEGVYKVGLSSNSDELIDVFVNPYSGVILGSQQWGHTLMSFIYTIHNSLLVKEVGDQFVGVCGLLLLVLVVSGLAVWPGWRKPSLGFWIRWKAPVPLLTYDLHKVAGFLSAVFLLLIASTGAAMVFSSQFESVTYWLTHTPKLTPPVSTAVVDQVPLRLEEILLTADAALPEGQTTLVVLPHQPNDVFEVSKKLPQDTDVYGRSQVYIDQYSGKVLQVDNALKAPLASRISNALLSLHNGGYGGLGLRCLYVLVGLVPSALSITSFFMWCNRNRAKYY
ncbi:MAG: PepSY domain-containing protein [Stigonema ocellatum SAG 48.90 = DSM 106950]|nr:PepSY domain-containing protein [Stigonema ocellatum SAG 48.90 = DSM 106950]